MILIPPQKIITYIYEYWKIGKSCANLLLDITVALPYILF